MDLGKILQIGAPAALVRGLDAPTRISVESGAIPEAEARAPFPDADVSDDGVSLTIATRDPGRGAVDARRTQRPARPVGAAARPSRTSS